MMKLSITTVGVAGLDVFGAAFRSAAA